MTRSTLDSAELARCVREAFGRWLLPRTKDRRPATVTVTLRFRPEET